MAISRMISAAPLGSARALWSKCSPFLRAQRHWLLLALAYLFAWWLPISWIWRLVIPGGVPPAGIDGPVSWMMPWWGDASALLAFQPLVPVGVASLIVSRRENILQQWHILQRIEVVERRQVIGGNSVLLVVGCLALFLAHLVHLSALAVFALILIAVGVYIRIYGAEMLKPLVVPCLFWLLMIPPPESITGKTQEIMRQSFAQASVVLLKSIGREVSANHFTILIGDVALEISAASSGVSTLAAVFAILLWYGLYRGRRGLPLISLIVLGEVLAIVFNLARVGAAVFLAASSHRLSQAMNTFSPWLLTLLTIIFALVVDSVWAQNRQRLGEGVGAVWRPVGNSLTTTTRTVDRTLDRSGQVMGSAGKVVVKILHPLFWVVNVLVKGVESVFALLGKSASGLERGLRKADRSRRRNDRW